MTEEPILVVEDDVVLRGVLEAALGAAGYEVRATPDIGAASALVERCLPAVAIISMEMRHDSQDSPEGFVRMLAHESPATEVILLANPASMDRLIALYDLRTLYNHRWKPLDDIGDLARDVARAMERRALKRQNSYLLTELRDTRDELRSQAEFMVQVERLVAASRVITACARTVSTQALEVGRKDVAVVGGIRPKHGPDTTCKRLPTPGIASAPLAALARLDPWAEDVLEPFDLNSMLLEAVSLVQPLAAGKQIQVESRFGPEEELVHGSRSQLSQVALHLLLNAIDAIPRRGVLTIDSEALPGERPGVRFSVSDTGAGIPPHVLPHVFEPFYTTGDFGRSTGLGLWAVRNIVRQHDGEISLDTAVGKGTRISVWLPAADGRAEDQANHVTLLRAAWTGF